MNSTKKLKLYRFNIDILSFFFFSLLALFLFTIPARAEVCDGDEEYRLDKSIPVEMDLLRFRQAYSEFYSRTPSPEGEIRLPAEFEPMDTVFYAWEVGDSDFYCNLTQEVVKDKRVNVVVMHHGVEEREDICDCLGRLSSLPLESVEMLDMSKIGPYYEWKEDPRIFDEDDENDDLNEYSDRGSSLRKGENHTQPDIGDDLPWTTGWPWGRSLDSDWSRDWGPFFIELQGAEGTSQAIVGFRYDLFRVNDDAVPFKLANIYDLPVFLSPYEMDGGNIITDGRGTCFLSWDPDYTEDLPNRESIERELNAYLGCKSFVWLRSMEREPTGHVDIFMKVAQPNLVMVGSYELKDDQNNSYLLDYNAGIIADETNVENEPFEVIRVPMPNNSDGVFRTYLNSLVLNDRVIVPVFYNDREYEDQALSIYASAFPNREIVTIDAEALMGRGGAVRCATSIRPAHEETAKNRISGLESDLIHSEGGITMAEECEGP